MNLKKSMSEAKVENNIINLKQWMSKAKTENENGKSLMQLSLETYISEKLELQLIETKLIKIGYEEEFRFIATNGENDYIFENEYYEPKDFSPHQQILILKEIRGKEGTLSTDHTLWLTRDNKKDKFLSTPLAKLLSGKQNDHELQYAVDYLKNSFKSINGYSYKEEEINDLNSFVISLNDKILIHKGFSNSIQCDFKDESLSSIQIVFKEISLHDINSDLESFVRFAHDYLQKNITLDNHNISSLYNFLKNNNLYPQIYTNSLLFPKKKEPTLLFKPLIIETEDMFSYHQLEISIFYLYDEESFLVKTNYLFREFTNKCNSVITLKDEIHSLINLFHVQN